MDAHYASACTSNVHWRGSQIMALACSFLKDPILSAIVVPSDTVPPNYKQLQLYWRRQPSPD